MSGVLIRGIVGVIFFVIGIVLWWYQWEKVGITVLFRIYESLNPENFWNFNPLNHGAGYFILLAVAFMVGCAFRSRRKWWHHAPRCIYCIGFADLRSRGTPPRDLAHLSVMWCTPTTKVVSFLRRLVKTTRTALKATRPMPTLYEPSQTHPQTPCP